MVHDVMVAYCMILHWDPEGIPLPALSTVWCAHCLQCMLQTCRISAVLVPSVHESALAVTDNPFQVATFFTLLKLCWCTLLARNSSKCQPPESTRNSAVHFIPDHKICSFGSKLVMSLVGLVQAER